MALLVKDEDKNVQASVDNGKKAAAKRHSQKISEFKKTVYEGALAMRDQLVADGKFDALKPANKEWLLKLCTSSVEKRATGAGASPVFNTLFGATPKVGDSIILSEVFNKTGKGEATLKLLINRWEKTGTIIECIADPKDIRNNKYVIKALPTA